MAYITNSTLEKLSKRFHINKKENALEFLKNIFANEQIFEFFNDYELSYLAAYKMLLSNQDILQYFEIVSINKDTYTYVNESDRSVKYHKYKDCVYLNNDFVGYLIPEDLREVSNEAVNDFRKWFKKNGFIEKYNETGLLDKESIIYRYNQYFPQKYSVIPLNPSSNLMDLYKNTGVVELDHEFDINRFNEKIENYIKRRNLAAKTSFQKKLLELSDLFYKEDDYIIKVLKGKIYFEDGLTSEFLLKIKDYWQKYNELKSELKSDILEYFNWTFKNRNGFDEVNLEKFGLECCTNCLNTYHAEEANDPHKRMQKALKEAFSKLNFSNDK